MTSDSERTYPAVRQVCISSAQGGQRIDNFLSTELKGVPRSHIYRILRDGQVRVNRGRIRPDYRLQPGDTVRIPPLRQGPAPLARCPPDEALVQVRDAVLFEDDAVLVLNKPPGLAVHGGTSVRYGVIELLRALRPAAEYLELAHRLDRDTSGCLLLAKRRDILAGLHVQLRQGDMDKRYLTLVGGRWPWQGEREVRAALRRNVLRGGERMAGVGENGKPASTRFRALERFRDATLLEARPATGRTHQIRVHAAHAGHPVAGDGKYGSAELNRHMARKGLKRLFLHAHSLTLRRPDTGRELQVSAPLAADLRGLLDRLERG